MTRKLRLLPQLAALIAATILAACGGGETAGVGSGGTGGGPTSSIPTVTGGITGFGSVVVDGTIWDERNAVIDTEVDPRQAAVPAEALC